MNTEELIDALSRPMFVYRMATPHHHLPTSKDDPQEKSRRIRRENALEEIEHLLTQWEPQL